MAALDEFMHTRPKCLTITLELLASLWGGDSCSKAENRGCDWEAYLEYHEKQCSLALQARGLHISARTHRDIIDIAKDLNHGLPKETVRSRLSSRLVGSQRCNEKELLDASIDLAARLISMMDIGVLQYCYYGRDRLSWNEGSLKDFVHHYFNKPIKPRPDVKLEKSFNARNLARIAGINIEWTSNLADHLRIIDNEDKRVAIFHHASFLKCQHSDLFPPGFIEETLRTIALLFPQSDRAIARWVSTRAQSLRVDSQLVKCGHLKAEDRRIEKFSFWHDNLVDLKELFDYSRPKKLSHWWYDRRNGVQWYTFWVAILVLFLTVFFGIVQCVEGALQVYKAYHPN